ncbi:erythromycin esterase family protein [Clostridium estertheticum]|uniref:erythromycin esterase family protein n=1 Tax=Clostridium estertheticum TaxID=238834 RepID=UPI001CF2997A|nr:erythromycin esterase family protein [Clostridium estertheticum]MCB2342912.1 erythromycin esterase family protein [Clostridium estertheticum]
MQIKRLLTFVTSMVVGISLFSSSLAVFAADTNWIKNNSNEIKSLTSEDYSDLEFLKPILKGKTVVALGENFHRVAEYSSTKTRLIKYLHEKLGFDVIAFESGLGECSAAYEDSRSLSSKEMMENSIFPIWHSKETLDLFNYIKQQNKTNNPLYLTGYDMQPTTLYFTQFLSNWISKVNKAYAKEYYSFEMQYFKDYYSIINKYGEDSYKHMDELNQVKSKYDPQYKKVIQFIDNNKEKLADVYPNSPHIIDIAQKALSDRMKFIEMTMHDTRSSYEFRDKIMTENVEWIMKILYPGKKVILWAHNDHLAKSTSKMLVKENGKWINSFTSMGELLNQKFKEKEYVLGFYMNRGKASTITTQKNFNIAPMPKGSLENLIMKSGYKNTFIDLSTQQTENKGNSWMFNPIFAAEDGMTEEIIKPMSMLFVPKDQYDGLIVIDKVNEPTINY